MAKIMILGAGILQLPAIRQAKAMGLEVVAVDMNPAAIGFTVPGITCEVISTIDTPRVLEAARRHRIDGIMTLASDMPMRTVAAVAGELGLVGIDPQTAVNTTDKAVMRRCLRDHGVPVPQFYEVGPEEDALPVFRQFSGDVIVKPTDNSGSRGVIKLRSDAPAEELSAAVAYSREQSRRGAVVIEEFMRGAEVSVETISTGGVCHVVQITDKLTTGAPYFVEMGHNQPSMLPEPVKQAIADVAIRAVTAVGIQNGPSHTEIMVTGQGPKVVELGARLGGDNITTHLVPLSTGVNLVECCIRIALGQTPDLTAKWSRGSAIRYLRTPQGRIREITGLEEARAVEGVRQVSIVHDVGDLAPEIRSSVDRVGFVIAQADTPAAAIAACEAAMERIRVRTEEEIR